MPRQPRIHAPGLTHRVMARGIEMCKIFHGKTDRFVFVHDDPAAGRSRRGSVAERNFSNARIKKSRRR
ncbi:hypothetical protein GSUB_11525 [Geoalkalibacter subterraneus]|uniref:Uncharacterized protein n=1 Tax=Geoalkalibacter subterraneus TaxID=483547 RepID=A0A0B5FTZ7_9BACT|nr:hypothetical protein GSUB_11525 [Geoalkalibacter subterraneus]